METSDALHLCSRGCGGSFTKRGGSYTKHVKKCNGPPPKSTVEAKKEEETKVDKSDRRLRSMGPETTTEYLRRTFWNAEETDFKLPYLKSAEELSALFDGGEVCLPTGCWIVARQDAYSIVAEWKWGPAEEHHLFPLEVPEKDEVIRHHPLRCELVRTSVGQHVKCCRPSHLRFGSYKHNSKDLKLRQLVMNSKEYQDASAEFCKQIDAITLKLSKVEV